MLNKIFIMGRLTRDPELRRTQTGTPVASFSLAVDRSLKSRSTAREKDVTAVPLPVRRSSGSRVRRPMRMIRFSMCCSFTRPCRRSGNA